MGCLVVCLNYGKIYNQMNDTRRGHHLALISE